MPEGMTFLPDERDIELTQGVGIVSAPLTALKGLAPTHAEKFQEARWRGLLAFCLLADAWGEKPVTIKTIRPGDSPFAKAALGRDTSLALWQGQLLGIVQPQMGVRPAEQMDPLKLPDRAFWYDGDFHDPTEQLNERDRTLLTFRLSALNRQGEPCMQRFLSALTQASLRTAQAAAHLDEAGNVRMLLCIKAIFGEVPGVSAERSDYTASVNPVLAVLGAVEHTEPAAPAITWRYQGTAFARSHSAALFECTDDPNEVQTLAALSADVVLLERYSPAWRERTAEHIRQWLHQHQEDRALLPNLRAMLTETMHQMGRPMPLKTLHLQWPWNAHGAAFALLRETLGDGMDEALARPFADKLCLLPGGAWSALGEEPFNRLCALPATATEPAAAVIPPLSQTMAAQGGAYLLAESFSFAYTADGEVQVSFALRGNGLAVLERTYTQQELRCLSPEEAPTIAVWPCMPLAGWRAYYVYLHGGTLRAAALNGTAWRKTEDRLFSVVKTEQFPGMVALLEGEACLGVLPNRASPWQSAPTGPALCLMEIGASALTLGLRQGENAEPLQLPNLLKTLLYGGRTANIGEEFLPTGPLGPVLPAAVELFSQAEDPAPLIDGHLLISESCTSLAQRDARTVFAAWKWNTDEASHRARRLMLHQAMLMASLAAASRGVTAVGWRITLPEDMAGEGRRDLWQTVGQLAPVVAAECGLPLAESQISHGDESLVLGAYCRSAGGVRGGFTVLDVGSSETTLALWLRGMNRPAVRVCLPLGVQTMLLDGLMEQTGTLEEDFANMPDASARASLTALARQLRGAHGRKELEKCVLMLDQCLCQHGQALAAHMNGCFQQGYTTCLQALILQGLAALMTSAGLALEQVGRDPLLNDHLPAEMTLVMTGRGSLLMAALPENVKAALAQFLRMQMQGDHPVRNLHILFSTAPKCEMVLGLACMKEASTGAPATPQVCRAGAGLALLPEELVCSFVTGFAAVFPQAAYLLYGHVLEQDGTIAQRGERLARAVAARHFTPDNTPEAALTACLAELRQMNDTERL